MTEPERITEILRDTVKMFREFGNPPPFDDENTDDYWKKVAERMTEIVQKHEHHIFAEKIMICVFEYLERIAYGRTIK